MAESGEDLVAVQLWRHDNGPQYLTRAFSALIRGGTSAHFASTTSYGHNKAVHGCDKYFRTICLVESTGTFLLGVRVFAA